MVVESLLLFFLYILPKDLYALLFGLLLLHSNCCLFENLCTFEKYFNAPDVLYLICWYFSCNCFFLRQIGVKKLFHLFSFLTIWYERNVIVPFHISTQTNTQKFVKCCWWCTQNLRCIILCKEEQSRRW